VRELSLDLSALMIRLAGVAATPEDARAHVERALGSGAALERFGRLVEAQGGDWRAAESGRLERAPEIVRVKAQATGTLAVVDTWALGDLVVSIGGGRRAKEDAIDPRVGLMVHRRIGDAVSEGDVLAELHLARPDPAAEARALEAFEISAREVVAPLLVLERIEPDA
jgi:thymidine phosphorylase